MPIVVPHPIKLVNPDLRKQIISDIFQTEKTYLFMIHFQEIIVHTAVTLKQIAIPLYIFASELHPIKAETSRDIATQVNSP